METVEYLEREISAEFSYGVSNEIKVTIRKDITPGCLVAAVQEAQRTFLAAMQPTGATGKPNWKNDLHFTLRYWHLEDTEEMVMVDIQCAACELPDVEWAAKSVGTLPEKLVPRFVEMLFKQGINLPN